MTQSMPPQELPEVQSNLTPGDLSPAPPTPTNDIFIRPASLSLVDAEGIARVGAAVFRASFAHTCSKKDMDGYLESNFTTEVILRELNDANVRFLVACLGEDIVAFSTLRLGTSEPCIESYPKCIELQRIYVDSTLHGTGTARTLMGVTLDLAKTEGYKTVWLGVWEHNVRAFRFYQKYGFEKVGGHVFMLGNERQTDWIVVKAL